MQWRENRQNGHTVRCHMLPYIPPWKCHTVFESSKYLRGCYPGFTVSPSNAFKDFNASQDYLVRSFCEIITIHCVGRGTCRLERVYSRAMSLSMPQHCKARQMPMAKDVLKELGVCLGYCCKAERQGVSKASDGITWHRFFSKVLKSSGTCFYRLKSSTND